MPMLGLVELMRTVNPESTWEKFLFILEHIPRIHEATAFVAFTALGVLVGLRFFKHAISQSTKYLAWFRYVPEVLVTVIVFTFLSDEFNWSDDGIAILGSVKIDNGHGLFAFPLLKRNTRFLKATTSTAILIAVVGFLDSIVAAKTTAARLGYTVSPNRELVALGASNLAASFIPGTLPAYGSITRCVFLLLCLKYAHVSL